MAEMDEIDLSNHRMHLLTDQKVAEISRRAHLEIEASTTCLYCARPLAETRHEYEAEIQAVIAAALARGATPQAARAAIPPQRYCNADCRDDHEYEQQRQRVNGKPRRH